jgi:hypothetical protein
MFLSNKSSEWLVNFIMRAPRRVQRFFEAVAHAAHFSTYLAHSLQGVLLQRNLQFPCENALIFGCRWNIIGPCQSSCSLLPLNFVMMTDWRIELPYESTLAYYFDYLAPTTLAHINIGLLNLCSDESQSLQEEFYLLGRVIFQTRAQLSSRLVFVYEVSSKKLLDANAPM